MAETRRRLHQPLFAGQVMLAYRTKCAVCTLGHRALLDAAHIVPDSEADGAPEVSNGLALCKIHHAAYDSGILGIRPDLVVEIHHRLLTEIDGPMLRHGLQEHHARSLMQVPDRLADRPDPARLEWRYARFCAALNAAQKTSDLIPRQARLRFRPATASPASVEDLGGGFGFR